MLFEKDGKIYDLSKYELFYKYTCYRKIINWWFASKKFPLGIYKTKNNVYIDVDLVDSYFGGSFKKINIISETKVKEKISNDNIENYIKLFKIKVEE